MICDLRDFTKISDNWPRDDVIDLLNGYFDAMSEPIARHGGEITEFFMDGPFARFTRSLAPALPNPPASRSAARRAHGVPNENKGGTASAPPNYARRVPF